MRTGHAAAGILAAIFGVPSGHGAQRKYKGAAYGYIDKDM